MLLHVPADETLSDTVVFELPDRTGAERPCERLRCRWFVGLYGCGGEALVAVELRPGEGDLAVLLAPVKLWAGESTLAV